MRNIILLMTLILIVAIVQTAKTQCPPPVFEPVSPITVACGTYLSPQILTYDNGETGVCASTGSANSTFSDNPPGMCGGDILEIWTATDVFNNIITTSRTITFLPAPPPVLSGPSNITIACGQLTPSYTVSWTNGASGSCNFTGTHTTPAHYFGYDGFSTILCDANEVQSYSVFYCGTNYTHQRTVHINFYVAPACPPSNHPVYSNCNCALGTNGTIDYEIWPSNIVTTNPCCQDGLGLKVHIDPFTGLPDIIRNGAGCGDQIKLWLCDGIFRFWNPWPNPVDVQLYQTDITAGTPEVLVETGGHTSTFYATGPVGHQLHLRAVAQHPAFQSTLDVTIPSEKPVQCNLTLQATGESNVNSGCDNSISAYLANFSGEQADCPSSITINACGQTFNYADGIGGNYSAPAGTSCTISGQYICKGQTCPLAGVVIPAPVQDLTCNDLFVNAYISQNIVIPGENEGSIYISAFSQSCIDIPISIQFYRDVSGIHQDEINIPDLTLAGGSHYFENLSAGKYVIHFNQAGFGCYQTQVLYLGIPVPVNAAVKNLSINNTTGAINTVPFEGVTVDAYNNLFPNEIVESATTEANGNFSFITLENSDTYKLQFHYQDAAGVPTNVFSEYEYPDFQLGNSIPDIRMPYSMLVQTRQLLESVRSKPNYEITYLLGFLDLNSISAQTRKVYDVALIDTLINKWRKLNRYNANDTIERLGRVYISIYGINEFANDAYRLSKLPPKALSEFIIAIADIGFVSDAIKKKVVATGYSGPPPVGSSIEVFNELQEKAFKSGITLGLKTSEAILKYLLNVFKDDKDKEFINLLISDVKAIGIAIKVRPEAEVDILKNLFKEAINNLFVQLYEYHIDKTQDLITDTYINAIHPTAPAETFSIAAHRVITNNYPSLLDSANDKTDDIDFDCQLLFNSADALKLGIEANKSIQAVNKVRETIVKDAKAFTKVLKGFALLFDAFKLANYGTACYLGMNRFFDNKNEQSKVPTLSFDPNAQFPGRSNSPNNNLFIGIDSIDIASYNITLDSILILIQNNQNEAALAKSNQLTDIDSILSKTLGTEIKKVNAVAGIASNTIPDFFNIYTNFNSDYQSSEFHRCGVVFNLATWFLDTTAISFIDTLNMVAQQAKESNEQILAGIHYMDSIVGNIPVPVSVLITGINGINEVDTGSVHQFTISYQNFGADSATQAYIKIDVKGGFILSPDSIYLGTIAAGATGELNFSITSPSIDTFSVFKVALAVDNGEGDFDSDYIISHSPKYCNYFHDADNDDYGSLNDTTFIMDVCITPLGYASNHLDCNDANADVHPGAMEICNGVDDNCNGKTDEMISKIIAVTPNGPQLYILNYVSIPAYWLPETTLTLTMPSSSIQRALSVATNPLNNSCFAIIKPTTSNQRRLVTVNTTTGVCSLKGNLGDAFASLTFSPDGRLFAVTGDGADIPETLYEIDTANAGKTLRATLGNGEDGEIIAFNEDDGYIYHWSGNGINIFEKIDTSTYDVTEITQSGDYHQEVFGAVYVGEGNFLISEIDNNVFSQTNSGEATYITETDDRLRGLGTISSTNVAPSTPVIIASSTTVCNPDSLVLSISSGLLNNASHWQWYIGSCGGTPVGSGDSIVVSPSVTTTYYARGEGTCISPGCGNITINIACGLALNLKFFIEGYYVTPDSMMAVLDPITHPTICDSITVELRDTINPFDVISSVTNVITTKGIGQFVFPNAKPLSYYIVVRHRNSIETWSKMPVMVGLNTSYDFTAPE